MPGNRCLERCIAVQAHGTLCFYDRNRELLQFCTFYSDRKMALLQQIFGTPPLPAFPVTNNTTVIGRHEDCDVVVESPAVSRRHAQIDCEDGNYFIEDLGSRNGTMVNGTVIVGRKRLFDGDQVEVSTLPFTFQQHEVPTEESGSWGSQPRVVSVPDSESDDHQDSVRRKAVTTGDRISNEELGTDPIRDTKLVSRVQIADGGSAWPVTNKATQKLNNLLLLLHSLRRTADPEDVISHAMAVLFNVFPAAERIAAVQNDVNNTGIKVVAAAARKSDQPVEVCLPVVRSAIRNAEALLYVEHWKSDEASSTELRDGSVRTILAAPLIGEEGTSFGAIQLDTSNHRRSLNSDDLEQLVVLNHVIAFAYEHAASSQKKLQQLLLERGTADAIRLCNQLSPSAPPEVHGYRIAHAVITAPDVAADLIDYVRLPDGRIACLVLDVPGRGPEAAGLMALLLRLLTGAINETGSAARAIQSAQKSLLERVSGVPKGVSVGVMIMDPERSSVSISIAGDCPLLMIHKGELKEIHSDEISGPPLGIARDAYSEAELQLYDNDVILIMTDGVWKLKSPDGYLLSRARKLELVAEAAAGHRSVFESKLRRLLNDFRGDSPLSDDVAFAMIHRTPSAGTVDSFGTWRMESETQGA
ncbi:SpoIIE family protein phosphatase [Fuerstiella marisgermanici]|nr:SpoIIE family protein phosphatase [Fuerstiella marisgermanici]